jgi:hypothetical protein
VGKAWPAPALRSWRGWQRRSGAVGTVRQRFGKGVVIVGKE